MSDHEAMKLALEALMVATTPIPADRHKVVGAIEALRTALAAPRPEPVAWMYVNSEGECEQIEYGTEAIDDDSITPLYTAPPAAAPEKRHPGYIIGNHWLETAYSRVCAGEAEADVLKDCGWERVDEALRLNDARYRWLRESAYAWGSSVHVRSDIQTEAVAIWLLGTTDMTEPGIDAAIDAAMQEDKT